jgi:uncharacterized membrane protein
VSKARLEAFSDGVFAVAITLLVLEIGVPGEVGDLPKQVAHLWPSFAAYFISFFTIGIIWVNHHTTVARFERLSRTALFLNLNLLLWVVLIPWSTALIAEHLRDTGGDQHFAACIYALNFFVMGVAFFLLWDYSGRAHLLDVGPAELNSLRFRNAVGEGAYLIAAGVAWISAPASLIICGLVAVYYIHPGPLRL